MIRIIAAHDKNHAIGKDGKLPWPYLSADMAHFRELTLGNTVIMGRKTYDSIGHALPDRRNIVLSHSTSLLPDAEVMEGIKDILSIAQKQSVWVIGGAEIYNVFLPYAQELHITFIDAIFPGSDTFFPKYDEKWILKSKGALHSDTAVGYQFQEYQLK